MCRVALPTGAAHCAKCGLRIAPLDGEHAVPEGPVTVANVGAALGRGVVGAVAIGAVSLALAVVFRDPHGYFRSWQNALGLIGGLVMVVAFSMGRVRLGAFKRHLDLAARMERERPTAPMGTRIAVAVAGAIPFAVALVLGMAGY